MAPYMLAGLFIVLVGMSFLISALDHPEDEDPR